MARGTERARVLFLRRSFVVAESDLHRTVAALHEEFFAELDPEVFERNEAVHA